MERAKVHKLATKLAKYSVKQRETTAIGRGGNALFALSFGCATVEKQCVHGKCNNIEGLFRLLDYSI